MKKLVLFLLILGIYGCDNSVETSDDASKRITYFKDKRTGICFAQIESLTNNSGNIVSIATVPCEKVEKYLK
jgi:hypothetical protein